MHCGTAVLWIFGTSNDNQSLVPQIFRTSNDSPNLILMISIGGSSDKGALLDH